MAREGVRRLALRLCARVAGSSLRRARLVAIVVAIVVGVWSPATVWSQSARTEAAPLGKLEGVAYDSIYARAMVGAVVQAALRSNMANTRTATTDGRGRFVFDSLTPGQWIVGASHPWLDTLSIVQLSIGAEVRARTTTRTTLAVPSSATLIAQACGAAVARDSSGYIFGTLYNARAPRAPVTGSVRVEWPETAIARGTVRRELGEYTVQTTPAGDYTICGVPPDGLVRIRAWSDADSSGVLLAPVPPHGIGRVNLMLGVARPQALDDSAAASDSSVRFERDSANSLSLTVLRGRGVLRGVVRTAAGAPLPNASVTVWGTGVEVVSAADGSFALLDMPTGSRILNVRAIGFQALRQIVDVLDGEPTVATVALDKPVDLATIHVRARGTSADLAGFAKRSRGAIGKFMDAGAIAQTRAMTPIDLIRKVPGIRVVPGAGGDRVVIRRSGKWCAPTIYVNGVSTDGDGTLDMYVNASDVVGVELYMSFELVPTEFAPKTPCGSIVFWTSRQ